ncbi:hypothetical protein OS493_035970 [Desmophyllum pertusum]|uniref:Uncharacterized protein n=1 Tax=Desmophyllum pertusum TaxID=174260 RepID=A0A9X0CJR8_9CNID|nr:hypothetical protein OS493_035970 [Desmophyllum pertusum]
MKAIVFTLIFQCCITFTFIQLAQGFQISRARHGIDSFNIPASMCHRNRHGINSGRGCKSFSAVNGARNCHCLCPAQNATFTFYNKQWSCLENRIVRRHLYHGCSLTTSFSVENADRRLPTLVSGERRAISVQLFLMPQRWRCKLDIHSSWFMGCQDSRHLLSHYYNAAVKLFKIIRNPPANYFLQVDSSVPVLFRGKIVNLIVECTVSFLGRNFKTRNCLLFKLEGMTTCPATTRTVTTSSTIQPLKTSSTTQPLKIKTSYIAPSTSRITTSYVSTNTAVIQRSSSVPSVPIMSVTPSQALAAPPTISDNAPTVPAFQPTITEISPTATASQSTISEIPLRASASQPTITKISPTATDSQPTITEISPTATDSQSTISEIPLRASASQPTISEISPTILATKPTIFEMLPTTPATELTVTEISPTTSATQPTVSEMLPTTPAPQLTVTEISPTTSATRPTVFEMLPTTLATQLTVTEISPTTSATRPTVSEMLPTTPATQLMVNEISPTTSATQPTVSEMLPMALATQLTVTEISPITSATQPTVSEMLPTALATQLTVTEISPTNSITQPTYSGISPRAPNMLPTASDTSRTPSLLEPKTPNTQPTNLSSNIPPSLSPDRDSGDTGKDSSSVGLTAGLTVTVIASAAIVGLFVYRRRRYSNRRARWNDSVSEVTLDTVMMSTPTNRWAHKPSAERDYYNTVDFKGQTLKASPFEISTWLSACDAPHSQINRSWEDDDNMSHFYAPLDDIQPQVENNQEPIYNALEEPVTNDKPPVDHVLEEDNGRGANKTCNKNVPFHYILAGPHLEATQQPNKSDVISKDEPIYSTVDELDLDSSDINKPIYNVLEKRFLEGSKVPNHYVFVSPDGSFFNPLEEHCPGVSKVPNYDPECKNEPIYNVLEKRYLEGSKVPNHYVFVSPNGVVSNPLEEPCTDASKVPNYDPECKNEPIYNVLEKRYLEGSKVPKHYRYVFISPNGAVSNPLEEPCTDASKVPTYDPECKNEPIYNVLEKRYLEGSKVPKHYRYVFISPNGPVSNPLEVHCPDASEVPNCDDKCTKLPMRYQLLEGRYLEGSKVPKHYRYVLISPNGPVSNPLEEHCPDASEVPNCDDKCTKLPLRYQRLEGRYLEGSEVPDHYVKVSPNGPVFKPSEELNPKAFKGPKYDLNAFEERYLEDSKVPVHYAAIPSNGLFYDKEELTPNDSKVPYHDPKCTNLAVCSVLEECYLEGSEVPDHHRAISQDEPVYNTEDINQNITKGKTFATQPEYNVLEGLYLEGSMETDC